MRGLLLLPLFLVSFGRAGAASEPCTIAIQAPEYAGRQVLVYRYLDLVTLRTEALGREMIDAKGNAELTVPLNGTTKAMVRIERQYGDMLLRPNGKYTVHFPYTEAAAGASIGGTMKVDLEFRDMASLDINALITDLNERLDSFLAEGLAIDEDAGMNAAQKVRSTPGGDTTSRAPRPSTLFVNPKPSQARVDTFEQKLRKFYATVKDPWFWNELEYGIAGLRIGPNANTRVLFERYVKDKPIAYDSPEQIRFLQSFYADEVMANVYRSRGNTLVRCVNNAAIDSAKLQLATNTYLKDDRLSELILLTGLYEQYHGKTFDRAGIERVFAQLGGSSAYKEHRTIATNMLWDLTAMTVGSTFPSLALRTPEGNHAELDTALHGAVCIAFSASWCTYCEPEMVALDRLRKDYGAYMHFVVISVDKDMNTMKQYMKLHPGADVQWFWAGEDPLVMDRLRMRSIPTFYLLNDNVLSYSPAPLPSDGMASILYKLKVQADQKDKIQFIQPPPPKRGGH